MPHEGTEGFTTIAGIMGYEYEGVSVTYHQTIPLFKSPNKRIIIIKLQKQTNYWHCDIAGKVTPTLNIIDGSKADRETISTIKSQSSSHHAHRQPQQQIIVKRKPLPYPRLIRLLT